MSSGSNGELPGCVTQEARSPCFSLHMAASYLMRAVVAAVSNALGMAGIECSRYSGHSFWIGAATAAAARGIEDSIIKTLGRWKSLAYLK